LTDFGNYKGIPLKRDVLQQEAKDIIEEIKKSVETHYQLSAESTIDELLKWRSKFDALHAFLNQWMMYSSFSRELYVSILTGLSEIKAGVTERNLPKKIPAMAKMVNTTLNGYKVEHALLLGEFIKKESEKPNT
jgi:hypothetical protein